MPASTSGMKATESSDCHPAGRLQKGTDSWCVEAWEIVSLDSWGILDTQLDRLKLLNYQGLRGGDGCPVHRKNHGEGLSRSLQQYLIMMKLMSLSQFWISPNVHVLGPNSGGHFIRSGWDSYSIPNKNTRTIGPVLGGSLHESCLYVGSFTVITGQFPYPSGFLLGWTHLKKSSRFLSNSTLSSQLCVTLEVPANSLLLQRSRPKTRLSPLAVWGALGHLLAASRRWDMHRAKRRPST